MSPADYEFDTQAGRAASDVRQRRNFGGAARTLLAVVRSAVAGCGEACEAAGEPVHDIADRLGVGEDVVAGVGVPLGVDARRAVGLMGGVLCGGGDDLLGQSPVLENRELEFVGGAE